ncbi:MAG: hypothetical protein AAGF60_07425 [Pseudomonadota bacterium]
MNNNIGIGCVIGCWIVAGLGGAFAGLMLMVLAGWTFLQVAFVAALVFVVAGALLSYLICQPLPPLGMGQVDPADTPLARAQADRDAPAPAAPPTPTAAPAPAPAAEVKPSTQLAGEAELASRKGSWTYQKDGDATTPSQMVADGAEPKKVDTPTPDPAAAAPTPAEAPSEAVADPVAEAAAAVPAGAEQKPEQLTAARAGGPDNLKMIKGVGPKLEALLHSLGFYHFDQIASWKAEEVAWVDQNLQGFKGRVSRDKWVAQAKTLAEGGETEFSKKVGKGGVYE